MQYASPMHLALVKLDSPLFMELMSAARAAPGMRDADSWFNFVLEVEQALHQMAEHVLITPSVALPFCACLFREWQLSAHHLVWSLLHSEPSWCQDVLQILCRCMPDVVSEAAALLANRDMLQVVGKLTRIKIKVVLENCKHVFGPYFSPVRLADMVMVSTSRYPVNAEAMAVIRYLVAEKGLYLANDPALDQEPGELNQRRARFQRFLDEADDGQPHHLPDWLRTPLDRPAPR